MGDGRRPGEASDMARLPRIDLPGIPQHVVQRGNNRLPCFLDDEDRARYRQLLREALLAIDCRLHAYVLMDNHVHLLVTPPRAGAIGQLMQRLGRQYVGQFNARHGRTGTLWEGRYKACLVDTTEYLLRCARYIDLNPVRARMTDDPTAFAWSSCPGLCGLRDDPLLAPHPVQRALGADGYRAAGRSSERGRPRHPPPLPATTTRLRSQRFPGDGGSQDKALCQRATGPSAGQTQVNH